MGLFSPRGVSLSAFVRGIVKALTDGQQALPQAREEQLDCHMDKDPDTGKLHPKTVTIVLPDGREVTAATYSLQRTNVIGIDRATVSCSARIIDINNSDKCGEMSCGDEIAHFHVSPTKAGGGRSSFEMTIDFKQREPSESEARVMESLDGIVSESMPRPVHVTEPEPVPKNNHNNGPFF